MVMSSKIHRDPVKIPCSLVFLILLTGVIGLTGCATIFSTPAPQMVNGTVPVTLTQPTIPSADSYQYCQDNYPGSLYNPFTNKCGYLFLLPLTDDPMKGVIARAIDFREPATIDFARERVNKSSSGNYNLAQVCDIWEYCYKNWIYIDDPNGEDFFSPASNTIQTGLKGDCDDYAILLAALVQAIGGTSRVVIASDEQGNNRHAYAEVYLGTSQDSVQDATDYICKRFSCGKNAIWTHHETDSSGVTRYWLNLDWWANYPGGPYKFDTDKKYYYPSGNQEPVSLPIPNPAPITIANENSVNIPYNTYRWNYFEGNTGDTCHIIVTASHPVDVFVMDRANFNVYNSGAGSDSAVSFEGKFFHSVTSGDFTFVLPSTDTYYVVIENSPYLTNGADAKTSVTASIKISNTPYG
jgi:transglutaminase-like putative cysteine protease